MPLNIMTDLETLGTGNDALILSIGAVKFDSRGVQDRFHAAICPKDAARYGLKMDPSTIMWWLDDDRQKAREALLSHERVDLATALEGFRMWYGDQSLPTWGNGATFDNVILRNAFEAVGMETPWKFWDDRCYRTVKNMVTAVKMERTGTHHDALADAESQANHLIACLRRLRVSL